MGRASVLEKKVLTHMDCPKCRSKLMVEDKKSKTEFYARCMKCGNQFIIKEGRTEQKKRRRLKNVPKGITITPADEVAKHNVHQSIHTDEAIVKQVKHVQMLNNISRQMKPKKPTRGKKS